MPDTIRTMDSSGFVKCTERDVLMGRGKRVSEWPGNIYFRQVVNKYRDMYNEAVRHQKVDIAQRVIDEISKVRGRFLREANPSSDSKANTDIPFDTSVLWVEVDRGRCIEKACQALREKEKAVTPDTSPFVGEDLAEKLLEQHRLRDEQKLQKKLRQERLMAQPPPGMLWSKGGLDKSLHAAIKIPGPLNTTASNNITSTSTSSDSHGSTSTTTTTGATTGSSSSTGTSSSSTDNTASSSSSPEQRKNSEASEIINASDRAHIGAPESASGNNKRAFPFGGMIERLKAFRRAYGHTAVPPNWPTDVILADWCTAQRQLYREVSSGYRRERTPNTTTAMSTETEESNDTVKGIDGLTDDDDVISEHQQTILDELRSLDFCWNYDDWHWNKRFKTLGAPDGNCISERTAADFKIWIRDQRQQDREGALPFDRVAKLKSAGVALL